MKYAQPSKNMVIQAGVELTEMERVVQGPKLWRANQLSLKDYAKMTEPSK